jgi:hypothetical protein
MSKWLMVHAVRVLQGRTERGEGKVGHGPLNFLSLIYLIFI